MTLTTVYDVHDPGWPVPSDQFHKLWDWLDGHGLDKNKIYRFELHTLDCPMIRVFEYAETPEGRAHIDEVTGDVAKRPPYDVLMRTEPPIRPWSEP